MKKDPNIKIYHFEQGTPEWFAIRKGLCTSSEVKGLFAANKGFATYLDSKLAEQFVEVMEIPWEGNYWMKRGKELEPIAVQLFEEKMFVEVQKIGFIKNFELNAGTSTDGIIAGKNIGVEVKCFDYKRHYQFIKGIDDDAMMQCQFSMAVSGLDSYYLVGYNPNFKKNYQLIIHKIERNDSMILGCKMICKHVLNEIKKLKIDE